VHPAPLLTWARAGISSAIRPIAHGPSMKFAGHAIALPAPFTAFRATEMRDPVDAELGTSILPNSKFAACRRLPVSNLGF
jgi:hypothetical protein